MKFSASLAGILALFLVVAVSAGDDKDSKRLQGTWKLESGEQNGKPIPEEIIKGAKLVIKGDKHYVTIGEKEIVGTHKLDPSAKPKTIDAEDSDHKLHGIYEISKGTFKVCFAEKGKDRPKEFTGKEGYFYHVWKRVKK